MASKLNMMASKDTSECNNLDWLEKKLYKLFVANQQNAVKTHHIASGHMYPLFLGKSSSTIKT